jgi:hypothetical protein
MRKDGQTDRQSQTDMVKLTVSFRNFVKVSKHRVLLDVTLQNARNFPDIF